MKMELNMKDAKVDSLIDNTIDLLNNYPRLSFKQRLKNRLKIVLHKEVPARNPLKWQYGISALGLFEWLNHHPQEKAAERIRNSLCTYFDEIIDMHVRFSGVDDFLSLAVLVRFIEWSDKWASVYGELPGRGRYLNLIQSGYEYLLSARTDSEGTYVYNARQAEDYVLADMLGMVVPFLIDYGRFKNCAEATKLGRIQYEQFVRNAMDSDTDLSFHGYEVKEGVVSKLGIVGWGRAMGWIMMSGLFDDELADSVMRYQREDGSFGWRLWSPDEAFETVHRDTSATAMIVYSLLATGRYDRYSEKIDRAVTLLKSNITSKGEVMNGQAECLGLGLHPMKFGSFPWTVGPTLAIMAYLDRMEK